MNPYLLFVLIILVGGYVVDVVLDLLNLRHMQEKLPGEFAGWYDEERYRRSQRYLRDKTRFGIVVATVSTPLLVGFILMGGFNWVDLQVRSLELGPIWTGLLFAGALMLGSSLLSLPASIWYTFVLEERYGFNRTTPATFVLDRLKSLLLGLVLGGPLFAAVLWFFGNVGSAAWAWVWLLVVVVQLVLFFVAPVLIMPLFNKFQTLPEGELRTEIEQYAARQQFRIEGIYTMDGSKRSSRSNAFFTGFGRFRRIVLFDTLVENHPVEELVAVLAHEVGHYRRRHIWKGMAVSILTIGLELYLLSLFLNNEGLFAAFGMENLSIYASFVFFGFLIAPINAVLSVGGNILSRRHEYQADAWSVRTYPVPTALPDALKRLSRDNLSNLTPHPAVVFLRYSHPPVLERIAAMRAVAPV